MAVIRPSVCLLPFWKQEKSVGQSGQLKKPDELRAGIRKSLPASLPKSMGQNSPLKGVNGNYKLAFSPAMQETLHAHQQDFMQEDTQAGMIYAFLEDYTGDRVCSKQLYAEALGNTNIPAEWETRAICEIMNTGISRGDIQGWQAHKTAKRYPKYGVQKGWERVTSPETGAENFSEITDAEAQQLGFPF